MSAMSSQALYPWIKHLVLIGGGHAQVQLLRRLGMRPEPGVKVTLICSDTHTPYSGMLPGYIAGHYSFDDIHIDLAKLCAWAGVTYINARVTGLDPDSRQVLFDDRPPIGFDIASINTGSTPDLDSVPGARAYALPVKPIAQLLGRWHDLLARLEAAKARASQPLRLACVGAGVGGCELLLAVQYFLQQHFGPDAIECHLVGRAPQVVPHNLPATQRAMRAQLEKKGVHLHLGQEVTQVEAGALLLGDGGHLPFDELLWVTGAVPAPWFAKTGMATDERGFLAIDDSLRSLSHPHIFAAGDCAVQVNYPREKAGVFAVRQGPILAENLLRAAKGKPLKVHRPQSRFLSLIATGEKYALASRGPFHAKGAWVWRWKDQIDRQFMQRFSDLPAMEAPGADMAWAREALKHEGLDNPLCQGCGGKVASSPLRKALDRLVPGRAAEDAARLPGSDYLQSVDWLTAPLSDLFVSGQLIASHCLSDIYAEGGRPEAALAIVNVRRQAERLAAQDLSDFLAGALKVLEHDQVALIGGHSSQGEIAAMGLSVTGKQAKDEAVGWGKDGAQPGDVLMLSRPLGMGLLLAGLMQGKTKGRWLEAATDLACHTNKQAAEALRNLPFGELHAVSDVTGFGVMGHASEIAESSGASIEIELANLPAYEGALELARCGVRPAILADNARSVGGGALDLQDPRFCLACDPQTSGGLLAAIAPNSAGKLAGHGFVAIGRVLDMAPDAPGLSPAPVRWK